MVAMIQAIDIVGTSVVVRVPANTPETIMRALDSGADGVIVPLVNTAEDARRAVASCRYPPLGIRSWGPIRASAKRTDYSYELANSASACIIQIETLEAINNLESILSVDGIDAVYVGPNDLALSIGLPPGDPIHQTHIDAVQEIARICAAHRVAAGLHCAATKTALTWREAGFRFFNVASDAAFVRSGATEVLTQLRAAEEHRMLEVVEPAAQRQP
jgi:4-hydroxy-2-oxoheptanedioate aldolase